MRSTFDRMYTTPTKKPPLKAIVVLSDSRPDVLVSVASTRKRLRREYTASLVALEEGLYRLQLERHVRDTRVSGQAIVEWNPTGYWILYTDASSYFVTHVLEPFLNKLYPVASRVYFNYKQILKFLRELEREYQGASVLTSIFVRRQRKAGHQKERGTLQLWELGAEEELQKLSQKYRLWIGQIGFQIRDQADLLLLAGSLTSRGVARLRYGRFSDFSDKFVLVFVGVALDWKKFFSGRERKFIDGDVRLSPYALLYPFQLESRQISDISETLSNVYSFSVIHGGNPYFAASLCDYQDGSSFGLTVLRDKVTITPMTKATPFALWKLTTRIQGVVGEGDIKTLQ
jgi:hypothetical protein